MQKAFAIHQLVKQYPEFQLGPISLELEPGTVLGYIGPNGSGKTTTMHCLVGLVKTDGGKVRIFEQANDLNHPGWKHDIGYVGDQHVFYEDWTAEQNLQFRSQFYPNWSADFARTLATKLELPLQKRAKDLSGGNRVKLSLIGALAPRPRLLLLDEPTSGLDPVIRAEVLDVLFAYVENGERAIFYSTHILSDLGRLADELAFLKKGKLLLRSAKDDLTDRWRHMTFRYCEEIGAVKALARHVREGKDHQVISADAERTLQQLRQLGVENLQVSRMTIDEIAVQILKGAHHVVDAES